MEVRRIEVRQVETCEVKFFDIGPETKAGQVAAWAIGEPYNTGQATLVRVDTSVALHFDDQIDPEHAECRIFEVARRGFGV